MPQAPPFPEAWGFNQLIGQNKTNILNASIEAWKNSGKELNATTGLPVDPNSVGMGAAVMFGMLPFVLGTIVYIRMQKLVPATFVMLLTTGGLHLFKLMAGPFLYALYIITGLAFAFSLVYTFWNKE